MRVLGRGGFATIYLGEHIHTGTLAAIKVLHRQLIPEEVEKFRSEASIAMRVVHHHIVRVLDFGLDDGIPFLVMEYAPYGTLRQQHPSRTQLPLRKIVKYVNMSDGSEARKTS
jgi:serine/threonine protein kinase